MKTKDTYDSGVLTQKCQMSYASTCSVQHLAKKLSSRASESLKEIVMLLFSLILHRPHGFIRKESRRPSRQLNQVSKRIRQAMRSSCELRSILVFRCFRGGRRFVHFSLAFHLFRVEWSHFAALSVIHQ
jgi:hypothetical protein